MSTMVNIIMIVKGLSQRNAHDPSLINRDLLKFSSIKPPRTNARIRGGIGKSYKRSTVATTAIPIIKYISKLLKDIKYTPVSEKNKIKGIRKVLGVAKTLAI